MQCTKTNGSKPFWGQDYGLTEDESRETYGIFSGNRDIINLAERIIEVY